MQRAWVRALILLITVAVTAGVVWRATRNEQARGRMRLSAQHTDALAAEVIFHLWDLRASLHAYVAPGQGAAFWSARARGQLDTVRARLDELEPATIAANHPLTAARASLQGLQAAERRVLAAVHDAQLLLAGDVIFTEMRDQVDAAVHDVSDARQVMARAASAREAGAVNEQSLLAGALAGVWILALILLTPVPAAKVAATTDTGLLQLRETPPADAPRDLTGGSASASPSPPVARFDERRAEDQAPTATPTAPTPAPIDPPWLQSLADLSADIGRAEDVRALTPLLERATALVGARGLVVWLATDDGQQLTPILAAGYDPRIVAKLGTIGIDERNLTATAFRGSSVTKTAPSGTAPGAVAIPLQCRSGTSGVLAAEVPDEAAFDRAVAACAVVAAQLATLFPSPAPSERDESAASGAELPSTGVRPG
jgi:hypothetical protein